MLFIAAIFFLVSIYIGYYRQKNIMIAQISRVDTSLAWIPGRRHPWQWITFTLQLLSIIVCLAIVYGVLSEEGSSILLSFVVLLGIIIIRYFSSALLARSYIMKNHKQSAEAFLKEQEMNRMFDRFR